MVSCVRGTFLPPIFAVLTVVVAASCSTVRYVPDGAFLLDKVEVESSDADGQAVQDLTLQPLQPSQLVPYVRQRPNAKWFSLFRLPLAIYSLSGRDTTRWLNRTLRNMGEAPVVYDSIQAMQSAGDLRMAMHNMGYLNATVGVDTQVRGKHLTARYVLHPGKLYHIDSLSYNIQDERIAKLLKEQTTTRNGDAERSLLRSGMQFSVTELDRERKRITALLQDHGYYRFNKDFIQYTADSVKGGQCVDVTLHLLPYRSNSDAPETLHPQYHIGRVNYLSGDSTGIHLRRRVVQTANLIRSGQLFSASALQKTYNNFGRLSAVRYTNIRFREQPDTALLDCDLQVSTNKPSTISFQPEGTNTAGDLGAAASLTYQNRNLFRGSELFSVQLRGAFEAITGLEGYQNQNFEEYSIETKLAFPRKGTHELSLSYDLQNRPEFHRRVLTSAWRYRWANARKPVSYKLDLVDLNYVYMPWISGTFKREYLDNTSSRNAILRYNYEDLFIMKIGWGLTYNDRRDALKTNVEAGGNLLGLAASALNLHKNANAQRTLFNIAFAQYAKGDVDYTHVFQFDTQNSLVFHAAFGIAWPYGNSRVLPFEKRYFSGGANSVRGWNVRRLGPGKYQGAGGAIDFINQTGDMKLDLSMEYRTALFWKLAGALFVDAGNVWTLRDYDEQPGGQFRFGEFYKQIAASYGMGLRLNFDYFILRFDFGMKAVNPVYEDSRQHWLLFHPRLRRDLAFHFAVGLPF